MGGAGIVAAGLGEGLGQHIADSGELAGDVASPPGQSTPTSNAPVDAPAGGGEGESGGH